MRFCPEVFFVITTPYRYGKDGDAAWREKQHRGFVIIKINNKRDRKRTVTIIDITYSDSSH